MSDNDNTIRHDAPTRRNIIKYSGAVVGGGLLAGCTGGSGGESPGTDTGTDETRTEETETPEDESYSVTMEPVGTVEFDAVPQSIAPFTADYIDMLVALGHGDAVESIWLHGRYKTRHYDELDGVSMEPTDLLQLWDDGISKEKFYEMDADLHLMDPHELTHWLGSWKQSDVDEIRENVAPFLGNLIFRRTDEWHTYRYYTLYEAFEKVSEMVQEQARFEAIQAMHDDLVADVQARLPAPDERPNAALVWGGEEPDVFYPYRLSGNGANKEHFRTMGLSDAFADTGISGLSTGDSASIDYETMLEVDPDSILVRVHGEGLSEAEFQTRVVDHMRDHEIGSELTAVENDRVFQGGPIYAGPLHNLFMIEQLATDYFPEEFTEDELVDRQRLSRIITEGVEE